MTCRRGKGRKVQGSRALDALRLDGHREARARRARAACSRAQESLGQLLQQALRGNTTCACPPFLALVAPSRGSAANGHYGRFGAACERVVAMRSRQACSCRGNRHVHSVQSWFWSCKRSLRHTPSMPLPSAFPITPRLRPAVRSASPRRTSFYSMVVAIQLLHRQKET